MKNEITELDKEKFYLIDLQVNEEIDLDQIAELSKNLYDFLVDQGIKALVLPTGPNLPFKKMEVKPNETIPTV